MTRILAFLRLSRPHFLLFSMLPYLLGVLAAWRDGVALDPRLAWVGLAAQLLIQLSTAYINDYFDLPTDRVNRGARCSPAAAGSWRPASCRPGWPWSRRRSARSGR